eukprot:CAMPEP_0171012936 /NCGR_PEP_ID=MMETSP0736-20130129/23999_1 /TAXON_ID=186038 /ORGANISM="Fragilariopsis kerguelensis, Strain L26-C5" /LENGTH=92 /DNA_ID=CAMNT_0011446407 /DNA_START=180 /DNA_END=459 /DNA_ORIENTATION=+
MNHHESTEFRMNAFVAFRSRHDDDDDGDDDNNNSLPGGDIIGEMFGAIFNPDDGDGNGSDDDGDILGGGVDDISMWKVSIGTALGDDAVGSF